MQRLGPESAIILAKRQDQGGARSAVLGPHPVLRPPVPPSTARRPTIVACVLVNQSYLQTTLHFTRGSHETER